jgi:hypothetical protein
VTVVGFEATCHLNLTAKGVFNGIAILFAREATHRQWAAGCTGVGIAATEQQ